jgi:hypothetical protein
MIFLMRRRRTPMVRAIVAIGVISPLFAACSKDRPRVAASSPVSKRPYSPPSVGADGRVVAVPADPATMPPASDADVVSESAPPTTLPSTVPTTVPLTIVSIIPPANTIVPSPSTAINGSPPIESTPTDGFVFVRSMTAIETSTSDTQPASTRPSLPALDMEALRLRAAQQLDVNYVEFGREEPDVERLVTFVAEIDTEAFRRYYQSLVRSGDRWRFATPRIESLTITAVEPVAADSAFLSTCELSNVERYRQHNPKSVYDDETISNGLESTVKRQLWVREEGTWKATIHVDRQIFPGENRCEK